MRYLLRPCMLLLAAALAGPSAGAAQGAGAGPANQLTPPGYGSLTQEDLSLRIRTSDIEVRFVPHDVRVTRLLARDSWESLRSLVESRRRAIDSVANVAGVSRPGLALVTFQGQAANARFDPQTLTVVVRSREFRPLGIVPFSGRFTSQQLNVREQVSAIYLFEEELPVNDSFTISYAGQGSSDWQVKQQSLDRERARVALRARANTRDTLATSRAPRTTAADSTAADSRR
jgi:hypothetical protein